MLRIGHGFDVHAFAEGRRLVLGGVDIPHARGLDGHSDADVLTHAIQKEGFVAQVAGDMTVVLDTNLTPALIEEGYVREIISKIQTMRKDADFDVTDRIAVTYQVSETLAPIVARNMSAICPAVLAVEMTEGAPVEGAVSREWDINGEKAVIGVKVAEKKQ